MLWLSVSLQISSLGRICWKVENDQYISPNGGFYSQDPEYLIDAEGPRLFDNMEMQ